MELPEIREAVAKYEDVIARALEQKYGPPTAEPLKFFWNTLPVRKWDLRDFMQRYEQSGRYPMSRLERVMHYLFDMKLELYYLEEIDAGLENMLVYDRGYDSKHPDEMWDAMPHTCLVRLSLSQTLIVKARILWDRIMNFIYYLETGEVLESKITGNKSKRKVFFEFIAGSPKWWFLEPYGDMLQKYDESFRTGEVHKASPLRSQLFGYRLIDDNELLDPLNRAINVIWENVLLIVSGGKASHFTDLHAKSGDITKGIDERYLE